MGTKISPELKAKGVSALRIAEIFLKPNSPQKGPPVPESWDLSWPGFFTRGIQRLIEEPPWKTWPNIPKIGLKEEIKRESKAMFEIVTGQKL